MRFLVDEDVAIEVARALRQAGHEVLLVPEVLGVRTDDVDIWRHAALHRAVVVTCNRQDFLSLAGTQPETGLIVLNRRKTRQAECTCLLGLLAKAGESGLQGNINFASPAAIPDRATSQRAARGPTGRAWSKFLAHPAGLAAATGDRSRSGTFAVGKVTGA